MLKWKELTWTKLADGTINLGPGNWWSLWLLLSPSIREYGPCQGGGIIVTSSKNGDTVQLFSPTGKISDVESAIRGITP